MNYECYFVLQLLILHFSAVLPPNQHQIIPNFPTQSYLQLKFFPSPADRQTEEMITD